MSKQIKYTDWQTYLTSEKGKEEANEFFKNKQIINIETLGSKVRFWYYENN